ncbi:hypothetical protein AB0F15_31105 [Amycolatopsis sp. NPDC026612]|uniref:hypothetical protein n=1 Tax=Amycolatopsis sp. NPDC026612 TaxID=3155466 RepID=UPI0033C96427
MRRAAVLAAAAACAVTLAQPAEAAEAPGLGHWEAELLAMPDGFADAFAHVQGNDSHGGYAGDLWLDGISHIVTWSQGRPTVHPQPDGYEAADVVDENSAGTILGDAKGGFWSQPLVLDHGRYERLLVPGDWASLRAVALNERGDVLANAQPNSGDGVAVLWPAGDRAHPVVITGPPYLSAVDIDDDGTVLMNASGKSYTWRDGVLQQLTAPQGAAYVHAAAIRKGQITGNFFGSDMLVNHGVRWRSPAQPEVLPSSSTTFGLNRFGLIVGDGPRPDPTGPLGPLSAWLAGRALGPLPLAGYTEGHAKAVGDDGTIAGVVSDGALSDAGRPVVWRYSLR